MQEKDLVAAASNGDREAFLELYRRYREMVYRHCYAVTLDFEAARDLFQEVWLKIYVGLRRIRKVESFSRYLKVTLKNTVTDYFRKFSFHEEIDPGIPGSYKDPSIFSSVREVLEDLSPEDRYLLFLRFYEGYTTREISSLLGLSESAVKMRLHRLIKRLRGKLS